MLGTAGINVRLTGFRGLRRGHIVRNGGKYGAGHCGSDGELGVSSLSRLRTRYIPVEDDPRTFLSGFTHQTNPPPFRLFSRDGISGVQRRITFGEWEHTPFLPTMRTASSVPRDAWAELVRHGRSHPTTYNLSTSECHSS